VVLLDGHEAVTTLGALVAAGVAPTVLPLSAEIFESIRTGVAGIVWALHAGEASVERAVRTPVCVYED